MNFLAIQNAIYRMMGESSETPTADIVAQTKSHINASLRALSGERDWYWWLTSINLTLPKSLEYLSLPKNMSRILKLIDSNNNPLKYRATAYQLTHNSAIDAVSMQTFSLTTFPAYSSYNTGTASMTNGSTTITGSGTIWDVSMVGKLFSFDNEDESFVITDFVSATELTADHARQMADAAAATYNIDPPGVARIRFYPVIASSEAHTLYYYRIPQELVNDTDVPDLPPEFHDYLIWATRAAMLHGDEERAHLFQVADGMADRYLRTIRERNTEFSMDDEVEIAVPLGP